MRALFGAVLALTVVAGPGGALAGGPSFNCKYAAKAAERAVCGDPSLSALDLELAGLYFRTQSDLPKGDARAVRSSAIGSTTAMPAAPLIAASMRPIARASKSCATGSNRGSGAQTRGGPA